MKRKKKEKNVHITTYHVAYFKFKKKNYTQFVFELLMRTYHNNKYKIVF